MPEQTEMTIDPVSMIRPKRRITGMSAILLPFLESGEVDWESFDAHVDRTFNAALTPAVNMDTGYANLIDKETRLQVLQRTQKIAEERMFVAGAFVGDHSGDAFQLDAYKTVIEEIHQHGGTPVIFQSFGLTTGSDEEIVSRYQSIAEFTPKFLAFELGKMFAPFGSVYSLDTYRQLLSIEQCIGAKHSSLSRELEWQRLQLRDDVRPDFMVMTGNDLAIDMVMYGSDYLLGLSTFAPDLFALRDTYWEFGDPRFYELNDILQYLGFLAFRDPVPAYKHNAAQYLKLRGWIETDHTHPNSPTRPDSDIEILREIAARLDVLAN